MRKICAAHAKPSQDLSTSQTELSDLRGGGSLSTNKTTAVVKDTPLDSNSEAESEEQQRRSYPHRDEDQLNSATNLVLAQNYKYDVEILESGDEEQQDSSMDDMDDLEERFKGRGVVFSTDTDTFASENIEMTPVDTQADAVSQGHVLLGIVVVALALISIGLYAGLVLWRSHLEQRYGMRERLVNQDLEEEAGGDDYQVYAPTTTPATPRA
ncbi:uncharacterized protein LOC108087961 isoform X2 [Drosophila ficusphila]|uniref:uncharacterized protein LOC108087961 isoform X2 n=1 Tax=Drosophila ficusphila TaxID=30025 RepID=UPI0007E5F628|nr:uncharacterized protein LOC108087961 isoform X2 [Drosophila ficusphila]